jgi:hypothetical protein
MATTQTDVTTEGIQTPATGQVRDARDGPASPPLAPVEAVAEGSCCSSGALWGWSPPLLPADTPLKRRIDRLMPRTGFPVAIYYGAVVALLALAGILPRRPGLAVDGLAALAAGSWCALKPGGAGTRTVR